MYLCDGARSSLPVEVVHVLRNGVLQNAEALELGQGIVAGVWRRAVYRVAELRPGRVRIAVELLSPPRGGVVPELLVAADTGLA